MMAFVQFHHCFQMLLMAASNSIVLLAWTNLLTQAKSLPLNQVRRRNLQHHLPIGLAKLTELDELELP